MLASGSLAQIATDGTVGAVQALTGPDFTIGEVLGSRAGTNLFHSFSNFNVNTGESATFTGANDITNVISRVTGGAASNIDGILRSTIGSADFWFTNPAGVMFGPNAQLDVPGSFHVTTADEIRFPGNEIYAAAPVPGEVLSVASPEAFGFLSANPAAITVQGLTINQLGGGALSVVGGDVAISFAASEDFIVDNINIASVGSTGEVGLAGATLTTTGFAQLGNIDLTNVNLVSNGSTGSTIAIRGGQLVAIDSSITSGGVANATGANVDVAITGDLSLTRSRIIAGGPDSGSGGDITVDVGGTLTLTGNSQNVPGISSIGNSNGNIVVTAAAIDMTFGDISTRTSGTQSTGDVTITTPALAMNKSGIASINEGSGPASGTVTVNGGTITLENAATIGGTGESNITGTSLLLDASELNNSTGGSLDAGNISVNVSGAVTLQNSAGLFSDANATGNAGAITISGDSLLVDDSFISSNGNPDPNAIDGGDAGSISITAADVTFQNGGVFRSSSEGDASAGTISITADRVVMTSTSNSGSSAGARGEAGDVTIAATESMVMTTATIETIAVQGPQVIADGGAITITTPLLSMDGSLLSSSHSGSGTGGPITLNVSDFVADNGSRVEAATTGAGPAGDIFIGATNSVSIAGQTFVSANTSGAGEGGAITIDTADLQLDQAFIETETRGAGRAGDIEVNASGLVTLDTGAGISAGTLTEAAGGTITIAASRLEVLNQSAISANTSAAGRAGDLSINVNEYFSSDGSLQSQTSGGDAGNIAVTAINLIRLENGGGISASTFGAPIGNGGSIVLAAPVIEIVETSDVSANTSGSGFAGDVSVTGDWLLVSNGAIETGTDEGSSGRGGTISIVAPDIGSSPDSAGNFLRGCLRRGLFW